MSFVSRYFIRTFNKQVGTDQFGNNYFIGSTKTSFGKEKRFVIYSGINDGSKVPPMWHAWLHYLSDELPLSEDKYDWQQDYIPNVSGTRYAYNPAKSKCTKVEMYSSWKPE